MEKNIVFNACQTPLEDLELEKYPQEVQEMFWDFLNNIPFIRWLISPDRPYVSQLPRDSYGRAIFDITKPPILENVNYFRQSAINWQNDGRYTHLKPNVNPNSEFGKWQLHETTSSRNFIVDPDTGMWISGDYYYMLNYCPMHLVRTTEDGFTQRVVSHPDFWDGQFLVSHYMYRSRINGHHSAELASRGKGKTSLGAAMLARRYELGETDTNKCDVQCFVTAADKAKLISPNQILSVFVDDIDFAAKHTYFPASRLKSSNQEMYWKAGFKRSGSDLEYGTRNTVMGISTGVNQDKLNGSRGVLYLIEEAGIFKNLKSLYNMIRPSVEQGTQIFGQIVAYGTAGDDQSDLTEFADMINSPEGWNIEPLDNVFDKEGQGKNKIAMFYPVYLNYDNSCVDANGNSDVTKALLNVCYDRYKIKYNSNDINALTKRISQYPVTPKEAVIRSHGNYFPVTELNNRIDQLDQSPSEYDEVYIGELILTKTGEVEYMPTSDIPIRDFPTKDNKVHGAIEIYAMPQKNSLGKVPFGRYIAACLKEGELVNTENGLKPVESITLHDRLINIDGDFVNIQNLQRYYNENPVYKVKLYSIYNSTTFSEEHPIYCATPKIKYHHSSVVKRDGVPYRYLSYDFQFKKVKDLKVGDVVKSPNIYRKEKPFMHYWIDNTRADRKVENPLGKEDFWWLLGLIIGDGWASCNNYNVNISFNAKEKQYIDKAKNIAESVFGRSFSQVKDEETWVEYQICCQTLNKFVRTHIGCGAENKHLAEWIKYIPSKFKKQLILGYLASDGSVTRNQVEFVSVSLKLLNDMQDILFSLGIVGGVSHMKHYERNEINGYSIKGIKDKYHLRIDRTHTQIMRTWNPNDLKLSRCPVLELCTAHNYKRVWMSEDLNYIYFKVADIKTEAYVGTVYNFECDTHTFMCNYIPTHNCDPYDNDVADTMSLGSFMVLDLWTDTVVFEYTGRPDYADDFYEICRRGCMFYNATLLYENNKRGLFPYFSKRNSLFLLEDTPEYLLQKQIIKSIGYGNSAKGVSTTTPVINHAFTLIRDWLLKPVTKIVKGEDGQEKEVTMPNLYNIKSRAFLKELVLYNPDINVDRIMCAAMLMIHREQQLVKMQGEVKKTEQQAEGLAADSYWTKNYPGKKSDRGM